MIQLLKNFNTFVSDLFRDRSLTLEQYIVRNNPQNASQVEALEREYYAKLRMRSLV